MKEELLKLLREYKEYMIKSNNEQWERAKAIGEYPDEEYEVNFTLEGFFEWLSDYKERGK
ncbi:unnamed protein product [marine sediment metagenome]|uniref:Uncharacterized protein n=1 Tax=marine sediment metagenome TaxID=412755 RepID=X0YPX4_9ZZZZ